MTLPVKLRLDERRWTADLVRPSGAQFEVDDGFETAVVISLFTRRRAEPDDILPDESDTDRQGWWGDAYDSQGRVIGSRLWLLRRSKATQENINRAKRYAEEALAWLVDDGAAKSVNVEVERYGLVTLAMRTTIVRSDSSKYNALWEVLRDAL